MIFAWLSSAFFRHPIISTVCFELILLVTLGLIGYYNPGNLGTLIARAVRYLFVPLVGLALVLWVRAGFEPGARRRKLRTLAGLCFFSPIVAARAYYFDSIYLILYYEAFWPAICLGVGFAFAWGAYGMATGSWGAESVTADGRTVVDLSSGTVFEGSRRQNALWMALVALLVACFSAGAARTLLRDAIRHETLEGTIEYLQAQSAFDESPNNQRRRRNSGGFVIGARIPSKSTDGCT